MVVACCGRLRMHEARGFDTVQKCGAAAAHGDDAIYWRDEPATRLSLTARIVNIDKTLVKSGAPGMGVGLSLEPRVPSIYAGGGASK